jgi:hypothetical protein
LIVPEGVTFAAVCSRAPVFPIRRIFRYCIRSSSSMVRTRVSPGCLSSVLRRTPTLTCPDSTVSSCSRIR